MAFPFAFVPGFRQRLLLAIGTTGVASAAAFSCTTQRRAEEQPALASAGMQTRIDAAGGSTAAAPVASVAGMHAGGTAPMATAGNAAQGGVSGMQQVEAGMSGMAARAGASGTTAQAGMSGTTAQAGMSGAPGLPNACSGLSPQRECYPRAQMEAQAKYGCGNIANPPARFTDAEVQQHFLANGCLEHTLACNGCCNPAVEPGEPQPDGSCCYVFCAGSCCGRPLIVQGQARLAGLEQRSDWLHTFDSAPHSHGMHNTWDARIAREWAEDARMEHASIAAFARFTLELLAFGAPAALVEQAQRAALEEVEHARLCFGLAARYATTELGPAPLSAADVQAAPSLWHAAIAAFTEGCIGETLAALQVQAALELAADPAVRDALSQIAAQEAAHAELAWRFVSWSVTRLGAPLTRALEHQLTQRISAAAPAPAPEREPTAAVAALHAAGRLTEADKQRVALAGVRDVIAPCLSMLSRSALELNADRAVDFARS